MTSPPYSSILKQSLCIGGDPERVRGGSGAPRPVGLEADSGAACCSSHWLFPPLDADRKQIPIRGQLVRLQAAACLSPKTLLPPPVVPPSIHSSAENMLQFRLEKRAESRRSRCKSEFCGQNGRLDGLAALAGVDCRVI